MTLPTDGESMASAAHPYHIPALLPETLKALDIRTDGVYVDATFGGGGHSRAILEALGPAGKIYGFDQDMDVLANIPDDPRFTFVRSNFSYIPNFMRFYGEENGVDGLLADLGVSFHHFDEADRGFSFRSDAPLDMRMNRAGGETAADTLNLADEDTLHAILRVGSDLRDTRRIARRIIKAREDKPLRTTFDLCNAVEPCLNPRNQKKDLSQVFQAMRIHVNHELDALATLLHNSAKVLKPGGRLAVITYHSLEDRLVKTFMRYGNLTGEENKDFFGNVRTDWKPLTRSAVTPTAEETDRNPRARSARLRVAQYTPLPS